MTIFSRNTACTILRRRLGRCHLLHQHVEDFEQNGQHELHDDVREGGETERGSRQRLDELANSQGREQSRIDQCRRSNFGRDPLLRAALQRRGSEVDRRNGKRLRTGDASSSNILKQSC